ncbi:MAG: hypothetical protein WA830_17750 [Candidatus Sulfotelmatobacter sp.]
MKQQLIAVCTLILLSLALSCGSSTNPNNSSQANSTTTIPGNWVITATETGQNAVFTVNLVPSPCSVATPIGTFTVTGPSCFIADNNTSQGSISGSGNFMYPPQGVLVGTAANPASNNAAVNLLFAEADQFGAAVFGGVGTISNGNLTGAWTCNVNSPVCFGLSGTFSGVKH